MWGKDSGSDTAAVLQGGVGLPIWQGIDSLPTRSILQLAGK